MTLSSDHAHLVVACHSKVTTSSMQNLKTLTSAVSEIRRKMQNVKIEVIWGVLGRFGSSAMSPFDAAHTTTYSTFVEILHVYFVAFSRYTVSYLSKL